MKKLLISLIFSSYATSAWSFPTVCSVVNSPHFLGCLELRKVPSTCGFPPRPCVHYSYYVPQYFIEVVNNPRESFFTTMPSAAKQLALLKDVVPFGADEDSGEYSYHAHTINVPFTRWAFYGLSCGGATWDNMCFTSMSEHLGGNWKTGAADLLQPTFLAWSAAPKACLIKGAVTSTTGSSTPTGYPASSYICSSDRSLIPKYPPSNQPVCNGWGIVFPRYGTVTNSDPMTSSLMIASRMRSLGSEVFQSVPTFPDEKWQMISPQTSSCFREGQNVSVLQAKGVSEVGRLVSGKFKNYLYVVWKRVGCTRDVHTIPSTLAWPGVMQASCRGIE